jgi:hypothetical protein
VAPGGRRFDEPLQSFVIVVESFGKLDQSLQKVLHITGVDRDLSCSTSIVPGSSATHI